MTKPQAKFVLIAVLAVTLVILWISPFRESLELIAGMRDVPAPKDGQVQLHFLSVGNADAALIRTKNTAILIDAGENDDEQAVVGYLYRQGIEKLDLLIASHADADHIGGMDAVVQAVPPKAAWLAFHATESADANRLFSALDIQCVKPVTPVLFNTYTVGDLVVQVLGPAPMAQNENDRSLMVRVVFGETAFLFAGDISNEVEFWLVDSGQDLRCDVFKAIHHGSADSNSAALLSAVNPSVAVISCGKKNPHGHPDPDVLKRLTAVGATVYRTDLHDTVVLTSDGNTVW